MTMRRVATQYWQNQQACEAHLGVESVEESRIAVVDSWFRSLMPTMQMSLVVADRKRKAGQIDLLPESYSTCSLLMCIIYQCQLQFCLRSRCLDCQIGRAHV